MDQCLHDQRDSIRSSLGSIVIKSSCKDFWRLEMHEVKVTRHVIIS